MRMRYQDSVDFPQTVFREPFECSRQKILSDIDQDSAISKRSAHECAQNMKFITTDFFFPSRPLTRNTALVFRRIFLWPSGCSVETHVLHVPSPSSYAVRHPISGTLDDVPVPRKINSSASSGMTPEFEDWAGAEDDMSEGDEG